LVRNVVLDSVTILSAQKRIVPRATMVAKLNIVRQKDTG
jgi:hypothetical protein